MDFVTFEIAKKLKEKGFKEECLCHYIGEDLVYNIESPIANNQLLFCHNKYDNIWHRDNIDAPTISQVLKWLRVEKEIFIAINIGYCYESYEKPFPTNPKMEPILKGYYYGIWELGNLNDKNALSKYFEKPEQATIAGIEYVLDNLI